MASKNKLKDSSGSKKIFKKDITSREIIVSRAKYKIGYVNVYKVAGRRVGYNRYSSKKDVNKLRIKEKRASIKENYYIYYPEGYVKPPKKGKGHAPQIKSDSYPPSDTEIRAKAGFWEQKYEDKITGREYVVRYNSEEAKQEILEALMHNESPKVKGGSVEKQRLKALKNLKTIGKKKRIPYKDEEFIATGWEEHFAQYR